MYLLSKFYVKATSDAKLYRSTTGIVCSAPCASFMSGLVYPAVASCV